MVFIVVFMFDGHTLSLQNLYTILFVSLNIFVFELLYYPLSSVFANTEIFANCPCFSILASIRNYQGYLHVRIYRLNKIFKGNCQLNSNSAKGW